MATFSKAGGSIISHIAANAITECCDVVRSVGFTATLPPDQP
jgi:hypothetical protein